LAQLLGIEVGIVLATVVDEHQLETGRVLLPQQDGHQLAQVIQLIMRAEDDGYGFGIGAGLGGGRLSGALRERPEITGPKPPLHEQQRQ
jgi:hypothetical protein